MGILDIFRREPAAAAPARDEIGSAVVALSLNDPLLIDFLRGGNEAITGQSVGVMMLVNIVRDGVSGLTKQQPLK